MQISGGGLRKLKLLKLVTEVTHKIFIVKKKHTKETDNKATTEAVILDYGSAD